MARPFRELSSPRPKITPAQIQKAVEEVEPGERSGMLGNLLAFCRVLRDLGLDSTAGRILDICRSLEHIDICNRAQFYYALRANLVSSHEDMEVFEQVFSLFWRLPEEEEAENQGAGKKESEEEGDECCEQMPPKQVFVEDNSENGSKDEGEEISSVAYSAEEVLFNKDFSIFTSDEVTSIREVISQIAKRLSTRMSRRKKADSKAREIDLRRTFRKNMKYGGEIIELARRKKRIKKTKVILLCDVSGSMDCYSKFLVQFIFGLQNELTNVETFVFSTSITRVSHLLERRSLDDALAEVGKIVNHWSGGTNIGASFNVFNEGLGKGMFSGKTIVMIFSDGWDRGDTKLLEAEMKKLRKRAFRILWLNPLLGSSSYQPLCEGIKTALPYVDLFMPLNNLESLVTLGATLDSFTR
ncbi:MAG: VWA domain-containing protein [Dehalococcoidia bacterium]|nr:VWA domain-containing protein [Dehalococcoidia bacterium]